MTQPKREPIFRRTAQGGRSVALVSITVAGAIVFSSVRCSGCGRWLMDVPGVVRFAVKVLKRKAERSGEGRVVQCKYCGEVEVVEL